MFISSPTNKFGIFGCDSFIFYICIIVGSFGRVYECCEHWCGGEDISGKAHSEVGDDFGDFGDGEDHFRHSFFSVTRRSRTDHWSLELTWLMWFWWVMIPLEDFTDVTLAIEDTDVQDDHDDWKSYLAIKVIWP